MPTTVYPARRLRYRGRQHPLETVCSTPPADATQTIPEVSISAVKVLTHYRACINCKRSVTSTDAEGAADDPEPTTTSCTHCHTKQKYADHPHRHAATLLLSTPTAPASFLRVQAYDSVLRAITQTEDSSVQISDDILLSCPVFTAVYSPERRQLLAITRD